MKKTRFLRLASALAFSVAVASAQAAVILDVLDDTGGGTLPIGSANSGLGNSGLPNGRLVAKVFQAPSDSYWTLNQLRLALHNPVGASANQNLIMRLYAVDANNKPVGSSLAATTAAISMTGGTTKTYYYPIELTGEGWKLYPASKYALVLTSTNNALTSPLYWDCMASSSYTTSEGFSFLDTMTSGNDGSTWSTNNSLLHGITIEASVPEPTAIAYSLVLLGSVGGYVAFRRRARA
jgi:hypothetical protein